MKTTINNSLWHTAALKLLAITLLIFLIASCKKDNDGLTPWYPETNSNGDPVLAVFESRVPCADCERLKLSIVIYGNTQTNQPSSYLMSRVYVGKSDDRLTNSGNLLVTLGTSLDPTHTVYQLSSGAPPEFQWFWRVNDDLLFVLDQNLEPRVGDAGYGYVLNRTR